MSPIFFVALFPFPWAAGDGNMRLHAGYGIKTQNGGASLEPVIDLVLSLQSFSNLWDKIMYCIYLFNNIYFPISFYMYMYMQTSIFD